MLSKVLSVEKDVGEIQCCGQYGNHEIQYNDNQLKVDRMEKHDIQSKAMKKYGIYIMSASYECV